MGDQLQSSGSVFGVRLWSRICRYAEIDTRRIPTWAWWGLIAVAALHIYFFQELVAAYLIFAILFGSFLILLFFVYALSEVCDYGLQWLEAGIRVFAGRTYQEWIHAGVFLQDHARLRSRVGRGHVAQHSHFARHR